MEITGNEIMTFVAVLIRVGLILMFLPFLGSKTTPLQLRIGLIVAISIVITPVVHLEFDEKEIVLILMNEIVFSFVIALAVRFIFYAVDSGAQVVATTMGLSMATVFNPEIGQSTEVARLYGFMAVILFLGMNGHHYFIYAVVKSFQEIPVGRSQPSCHVKNRNKTEWTCVRDCHKDCCSGNRRCDGEQYPPWCALQTDTTVQYILCCLSTLSRPGLYCFDDRITLFYDIYKRLLYRYEGLSQ